MANPLRAFSVLGFGAVIAGGIAWTSGELQRYGIASPFVERASTADAAPTTAQAELSKLTQAGDSPANPAVDQAVLPPTRIPAFDIVRVQPDGSMVIAGRAMPGATIDIIAGGRIIGQTSTDESGSFAFVLEQPLAPGDYEIGLSAKANGETLLSEEKAIVQIPQQASGDVLAIVTAPGTAPEVLTAGAVIPPVNSLAVPLAPAVTAVAPTAEVAPQIIVSANPNVPVATVDPSPLRIEAVEIDGSKTFIAGTAPKGSNIRVYLGDTLVGDAKANDAGRFLVESKKAVPLGTQILRADSVDANGQVTGRASVPFERVESEKLSMVAPSEPVATSTAQPTPTTIDTVLSPALTQVDTSVIIRKGDTLWQIARRVYGKGVTFSTIYNANTAQIDDPNRIFPGQVFAVPRNTETGDAADFNAIEGQKKEDVIIQ